MFGNSVHTSKKGTNEMRTLKLIHHENVEMPPDIHCAVDECLDPVTGIFQVVDAETEDILASLVLCEIHREKLAGGEQLPERK